MGRSLSCAGNDRFGYKVNFSMFAWLLTGADIRTGKWYEVEVKHGVTTMKCLEELVDCSGVHSKVDRNVRTKHTSLDTFDVTTDIRF